MLVFGVVSLIHPTTGAVLVVAGGTDYYLRLTATDLEEAARIPTRIGSAGNVAPPVGLEPRQVLRLNDGSVFDVSKEYGPDWIIGDWGEREPIWLANSFLEFGRRVTGRS